jgi:hypothetical protein
VEKHVATIGTVPDARVRAGVQSRAMARKLCRIKLTVSEVQACPEGACPFWEHGGAVLESRCGLERLQLDLDRADLAGYLVELREQLEAARDDQERRAARQAFAVLVPPELSGR